MNRVYRKAKNVPVACRGQDRGALDGGEMSGGGSRNRCILNAIHLGIWPPPLFKTSLFNTLFRLAVPFFFVFLPIAWQSARIPHRLHLVHIGHLAGRLVDKLEVLLFTGPAALFPRVTPSC